MYFAIPQNILTQIHLKKRARKKGATKELGIIGKHVRSGKCKHYEPNENEAGLLGGKGGKEHNDGPEHLRKEKGGKHFLM